MTGTPATATGPRHEVPTMRGPSPWLALFAVPWIVIRVADAATDPTPGNLAIEALAVLCGLVIVFVLTDHRPWSVTVEGDLVEVRGRWSTARFRLADITWVIDPVMALTGPIRVRRLERRVFGIPLPPPVLWSALVSTHVHPATWVRRLGVPEERVRGGGLSWRRRGLR